MSRVPSLIVALSLLPCACVLGPPPNVARNVAEGEYCASQNALDTTPASHPPPEEASAPARVAVERGYTPRSLDTARAIGAVVQVERLAEARARDAPESEIVDLRGQLNDAIALATLDLSSTVANISCEEGRAGQIATDLRDAERVQTRNLTAYSLAVTAAAAIGGGALAFANRSDPTPAAGVGIAGGVAGGSFGLATLAVHRSTTYLHRRNVAGQIWYGGAHPDFPDLVWAYVTRPEFTGSRHRSIREALVKEWMESGRLGDDPAHPSPERVALYFGQGGTYDADGLDDRADMLSEVREAVDLMNHDLQHLASEAQHR
ncbi:MAG TPA: hypothetical protein VIF15_21455 [Polyangiaceae bacterium]